MRKSGSAPTKRLKMKDLERATGVGRETIRFYIREGLAARAGAAGPQRRLVRRVVRRAHR